MPLSLTDSRWRDLQASYGTAQDVVTWLKEAYESGGFSDERLGDLVNEVQHQGDTSTAMYAVAMHLIELARKAPAKTALSLLTHAGVIYANSQSPRAVACPEFLREEFAASASAGAELLSPLLPQATEFDEYKWAVAGLAGFVGHHSFARFLDGLDLYEGQFHHIMLDKPFPKEL